VHRNPTSSFQVIDDFLVGNRSQVLRSKIYAKWHGRPQAFAPSGNVVKCSVH